ncbi:MAG: ATP-binding cassette domain-containing protein [Faecalimonas umbilicata]|uniref:ABC transporter ATP-binding protein n=1 Tax=Faecalimonas umbilicata TaxID=1912855 RepID=UPI002A828944|nr:ATP-binding cassette domain-containing protein [Faecalimonas umbilicata]MDY5093315.1 ATP-binding cassette domain-containing protein [Faecalimonas umbilicata]
MNEIIRTKNLCKCYKETTALNNLSLHIPQGSIYGLIGNNGAGKTTLMRILADLQRQSSGTVVKSSNIKIGAIIETPALYPTLSARGNLMYQLKICGYPSKEIKPKISELLKLVHLKDTRKMVMNYSLGMKQRLGLAMALVGDPDFLILDEPLNGLDPEGIKDFRSIIARLNEEFGVTIMISSHILSELQKVANHYGFLKNGVLIQEISSSEIADTDLEAFYFKNFL